MMSVTDNRFTVPALGRFRLSRAPAWLVYAFAVAITLLTLWARIQWDVFFTHRPLLILLVLPILVSAYLGGLSAGLIATLTAALGADFFLVPPTNSFLIAEDHDLIQWGILIVDGVLISVLSESLRRSRRRVEREMRERLQAEEGLRESEQRFSTIFEKSAFIGALSTLPDGRLVQVNEAFERAFGYAREEAIGKTSLELGVNPDAEGRERILAELRATGSAHGMEIKLKTKSGGERVFLQNVDLVEIGGEKYILNTSQDITERKRAEARHQHLARLYATLSQVNQVIVRAKEENELFQSICRVAVDYGKFGLAWIGLVDRATGAVTPVAVHGVASDRLPFQAINYKESPFKEGLIGEVVNAGKVSYTQDIQTDPAMRHWRELAVEANYHAAAAIPIRRGGEVTGFLKLYATDVNDFADEEQHDLLKEIEQDISFALDSMETEAERKRAEETIITLARFPTENPNPVLRVAMDGRVIYANEASRPLLEEWNIGVGDSLPPTWKTYVVERARERSRVTVDVPCGERVFSVMFASIPEAGYVNVYGRDITERTRAEESLRASEERYRSTLDSMLEGCQIIGFDWRYLYLNDAVVAQSGYRRDELIGRTMMEMYPGIEHTELFAVLERCKKERASHRMENEFAFPDGSKGWYDLSIQSVEEGLFILSHDITERKRAEAERLARESAEQASRAKSDFLSRMSHELRTPLNSILGFAQLLKMDKLEPNQRRGAEQIYKSGRHLLELVNEVLDIARIEGGGMHISPEPVRLSDAVADVLDLIRPMAEARRLSLGLKIPSSSDVFVLADRQRFKQVLLNLLSNAVKYNREGGEISVVANLTISGYLRLQVRDTGEGIPPEKMERLFVPFDRLDADFSEEGTGLGLALSKGLVEAMGGRVGAESRIGEGSVFWIELKLATEKLMEVIMAEVDENLTERIRNGQGLVLYVEDNLANVNLVEAIIERLPEVKLITAMQGRLALELAKEHRLDLILLDLHLPDMHGAEVLRQLKADPATMDIPVVVISADAMPAHIERLMAQGASVYLTKPIDVKEFLKVIEEHF